MRALLICLSITGMIANGYAQNRILITEQNIKLKGTDSKSIHFACAQGDRITVEVVEAKGKPFGEIQIVEYPNSVRHSEIKVSRYSRDFTVKDSSFQQVNITGQVGGRVCNVKIYRTPSSPETIDFDTKIVWVEKVDTVWHNRSKQVIIGYEPGVVTRTKRDVIRIDTSFVSLTSKAVYEQFQLPVGVKANSFYPQYSKEVVSWSYWIGVGQNALNDYEWLKKSVATGLAAGSALMGAPILGQLAATGVSLIPTRQGDDYVSYSVKDV